MHTVCSQARIFAVCLPGRGFGWEDDLVGRFSVLEHTALSEGLQEMTYKGLLTHTFGGFLYICSTSQKYLPLQPEPSSLASQARPKAALSVEFCRYPAKELSKIFYVAISLQTITKA